MSENTVTLTEEEEEEELEKEEEKETKSLETIIKEDETDNMAFGDYQMGELIAVGGSAKVYKGLNMKNGQFVAIKEIQLKNETFVEEELPKILSEITLLRELSHPNIVRYIDYHMKEKICLHIVLEYIENGSLQQTVKKFGSLPEILVGKYSLQVLKGLEYLHDKNIIHRDIKGANILITKQGYCKLADFGVATQMDTAEQDTVGTPYWMAPELFDNSTASFASDVWSFGITVLELLTGNPPYFDKKPVQAIFEIMDNPMPPIPPGLPEDLVDFLTGCFKRNPQDRPTVKELMNHPWIIRNNNDTKIFFKEFEDITHSLACNSNNLEALNKLKKVAENNPEELLERLQEKPPGDTIYSDDIDILRKQLAAKYAENELLISIANAFQREVEQKDKLKQLLLKNINVLEDTFATSDTKLSKKIYGNLHFKRFNDSTKGVLLVKKAYGRSNSYKWMKSFIVLENNFLFFYRADENQDNPIDVMKLKSPIILPIAERDIGKKFCFKIDSGKRSYFLCAANGSVLMKWLKAIQEASNWYEHSLEDHAPSASLDLAVSENNNNGATEIDEDEYIRRHRSLSVNNAAATKSHVDKTRKRSPIAWHLSLTSKLVKQSSTDSKSS